MNNFAIAAGAIALAFGSLTGAAQANAASLPPAFAVCTACHKVSADGANSVGPNLKGVVGRKAGAQPKYAYSGALKNTTIVWTVDKLDQWLAGPAKMVPGTKMFQSVPSPANRKAIIDYLATLK
nr:c-type cytochrome [Sphingomonas sp. CDS-1]